MSAIVVQLQLPSKSPKGNLNNTSNDPSGFGDKNKENDTSKDKEQETGSHHTGEVMKDKVLEEIQTKIDALAHNDTLQKVGIVCPSFSRDLSST